MDASTRDLPDLSGKIAVVTGATSGIGREIAGGIARTRARVVLACRDEDRGHAVVEDIARATGNEQLDVIRVDLSHQASIREFAEDFEARHGSLHVLVNDAGVYLTDHELSADGIEMTWATNVLGYHLLTTLLLDRLRASAPSRIVNVAAALAGSLDLDDLQFDQRRFDGNLAYWQSKQADRMLTWELARRLEGSGVTVNAVYPGPVSSGLDRNRRGGLGARVRLGRRRVARPATEGADTAVWLATAPEIEGVTGRFWFDRREIPCRFRDAEAQRILWDQCESLTARDATGG